MRSGIDVGTDSIVGTARRLLRYLPGPVVHAPRAGPAAHPLVQQHPDLGGASRFSVDCEAKRLSPSRSARYLVTSWPRTLLPAGSSGGEKVARPPLPGETVTMPPLTPLLPGIPIS